MHELAKIIQEKALYKSKQPMFGKDPGTRYTWQFYMANVTQDGSFMRRVCIEWENLLSLNNIDPYKVQFAGKHWGSLPILGALAYHFNTNVFSVREKRKTYGRHNLIEGIVDDRPVLIVDAVANSTNAFAFVQEHMRTQGVAVLDKCLCIMNKKRKNEDGYLWDRYSEQEIMSLVSLCQIEMS